MQTGRKNRLFLQKHMGNAIVSSSSFRWRGILLSGSVPGDLPGQEFDSDPGGQVWSDADRGMHQRGTHARLSLGRSAVSGPEVFRAAVLLISGSGIGVGWQWLPPRGVLLPEQHLRLRLL